jgi:hypothetical protein
MGVAIRFIAYLVFNEQDRKVNHRLQKDIKVILTLNDGDEVCVITEGKAH